MAMVNFLNKSFQKLNVNFYAQWIFEKDFLPLFD